MKEALEKKINTELQKLNPRYHIRNLKLSPQGDYWFDLEMKFNPKDMPRVNRVFKKYLGKQQQVEKEEVVQAKYYIRRSIVANLRQMAARTGRTQSEIVEEQLSKL